MRLASAATLCLLSVLVTPVFAADDQGSKQDVEKIAAAYKENFDKQRRCSPRTVFSSILLERIPILLSLWKVPSSLA